MNWMLMLVILVVIAVVYIGFHRWGKMMRKDKSFNYLARKNGLEDPMDDED